MCNPHFSSIKNALFIKPTLHEFMKLALIVVFLQMLLIGSLQASYEIDCPDNLRNVVQSFMKLNSGLSDGAMKIGL